MEHKGTLGCFLSHAKIWELVAVGDSPHGLVVEDDVQLQHAIVA